MIHSIFELVKGQFWISWIRWDHTSRLQLELRSRRVEVQMASQFLRQSDTCFDGSMGTLSFHRHR